MNKVINMRYSQENSRKQRLNWNKCHRATCCRARPLNKDKLK